MAQEMEFYPDATGLVFAVNPKTGEAKPMLEIEGVDVVVGDPEKFVYIPRGSKRGSNRMSISMAYGYSDAEKKQAPGYDPHAGIKEMLNRRKDNGRVD
jgi:hypothetical protein